MSVKLNASQKKTLNRFGVQALYLFGSRAQAKLAVKDEYVFDFLELGKEHAARDLQRALIGRIEDFLRAMGGLFAFVGSEFRLDEQLKVSSKI